MTRLELNDQDKAALNRVRPATGTSSGLTMTAASRWRSFPAQGRANGRSSSRSGATAATNKCALTRVSGRDMAARGLYKATDGSWRQADADKGIPLLYRLK